MAVPEDCSWLPKYPASIISLVMLGAAFQPCYAGSSFPVPSIGSWKATYPDRIERKVQHVSRQQALFQAGRIALPQAPVPPLSWEGEYPARLDRRRLPVAATPSYFSVPFARATQLTQQPSYPDRVYRDRVHPARLPFSFHKLEAIPAFLSWKGEQPERVWPKRGLSPASQQAYSFHPNPVADPDPPGLGYETTSYPHAVRPLAVTLLPVTQQQTFAANLDPLPNPPPPTDFSWPPTYPDFTFVLGSTEGVSELLIAPLFPTVVSDMDWRPIFPDRLSRPPARLSLLVEPLQVGGEIEVATNLAWLASYPDRLTRASNVNDFIGFDPLSVASLLPAPPECVELTEDDLGHPQLLDQQITRSQLINEFTTEPLFREEQAC
jgi:hypothetical protein